MDQSNLITIHLYFLRILNRYLNISLSKYQTSLEKWHYSRKALCLSCDMQLKHCLFRWILILLLLFFWGGGVTFIIQNNKCPRVRLVKAALLFACPPCSDWWISSLQGLECLQSNGDQSVHLRQHGFLKRNQSLLLLKKKERKKKNRHTIYS